MGIFGLVLIVVTLAFVGNAMTSPAERSETKARVDRFAKRYLLIPTILLWVIIVWGFIIGDRMHR